MRKTFQVSIQTVREAEWNCGKRRVAFGKLRIDLALDRNFGAAFFEIAAPHIGHERHRWTNAKSGTTSRFDSVSAGNEFDFTRPESVVRVKSECHTLFVSFRDSQFLDGLAADR